MESKVDKGVPPLPSPYSSHHDKGESVSRGWEGKGQISIISREIFSSRPSSSSAKPDSDLPVHRPSLIRLYHIYKLQLYFLASVRRPVTRKGIQIHFVQKVDLDGRRRTSNQKGT